MVLTVSFVLSTVTGLFCQWDGMEWQYSCFYPAVE
jgi:hypothetical protein